MQEILVGFYTLKDIIVISKKKSVKMHKQIWEQLEFAKSCIHFQLFMCLFMCTVNVQGIKVKFGTKDGPIEPPTPEPQPPPQPYRDPAPVWEERPDDTADPNAHW